MVSKSYPIAGIQCAQHRNRRLLRNLNKGFASVRCAHRIWLVYDNHYVFFSRCCCTHVEGPAVCLNKSFKNKHVAFCVFAFKTCYYSFKWMTCIPRHNFVTLTEVNYRMFCGYWMLSSCWIFWNQNVICLVRVFLEEVYFSHSKQEG